MTSDFAFKIIEEIAKAKGNNKIAILKIYPDISLFLLAAYDPFTHYYLTKVKLGKGDMEFVDITWQILYKLSTRELSGHSAQMIINSITEGMTSQSSELFKRILNKDLRMGMGVKSINKAFPGLIPTHDVMLAKLFETDRVKYPCFGSPKIDGVRGEYKKSKFYSRGGHEYVGLGHLCKELQSITEPIDGELTIPNMSFQESSGLIRSDNLTPNAVFNIIELPTIKESYTQRLTMIRDLHQIGPHVLQIPRQLLKSEDEVFAYYKVCRNAGYEGVIITPYDYEYKGTRSYDWMKIKEIEPIDLMVVGIYEGKGKYKNQMGGAHVIFHGLPNKVGGGWSDKQRKDFWQYPEDLIGKCIQVLYMEKTDDGNMRHARFDDFRPDKEV